MLRIMPKKEVQKYFQKMDQNKRGSVSEIKVEVNKQSENDSLLHTEFDTSGYSFNKVDQAKGVMGRYEAEKQLPQNFRKIKEIKRKLSETSFESESKED